MKRLLLFNLSTRAGLIFAGLLLSNIALAQPVPEILYYNFDGSGTTVPNLASNPPAGTATANILGGVSQGSSGLCGGALIGSGNASTSDYLNTGYATNLTGSWTISWWCQGISTNTTLYYIFGDASAGGFRCFTNGVAGSTNWILRGPGMTDVYLNGGATAAPHVCTYVYDSIAGNITGYIDGVAVTTVAQPALSIVGTGPFKVMGYSSNIGAPLGGLMDEFRMYDHALTPQEVMDLQSVMFTNTETVSVCNSYFWPVDSTTYTSTGQYSATLPGSTGCDTTMILDLTVTGPISGTVETIGACESYFWNGSTYTASGMYYDTVVTSGGCDSVNTLDLTISFSPSEVTSITACDSYDWSIDGNTYSMSGTYSYYAPGSAVPCDSLYTLVLTINESTSSSITDTVIDTYTAPSGTIYTSSGIYTDVIPNAAGCDSTITINLTVQYLGINEIDGVTYTLYPNPSDDHIRIEGLEGIADLKAVYITAITGERVMTVADPFKEINIKDLASGTYVLQIESGSGISSARFVRK